MLFVSNLILCSVLSLGQAASIAPAGHGASAVGGFAISERYRANLGGESGEYTDWERMDIDRFDGLATTIHFDAIRGKARDKWSSLARINLFGGGAKDVRPLVSVILAVDRKTHDVLPSLYRGKQEKSETFDISLSADKSIDLKIFHIDQHSLLVIMNEATFDVPVDFDIKAVSVIGSGADVRFEPLDFLRKK
jgi:hypothetical protein